jgi:excisionase family DNA binding protein
MIRTNNARALESRWHGRFASQRVRGEWFNLSPEDVAEFCAHSSVLIPLEVAEVKLYSLKEAGEVLGVSYTTTKIYHSKGRIKGQRIGRSVFVSEEELQRFLRGDGGVKREVAA